LLNFQPLFCNVTGCCWDGTSWWNRPVACMESSVRSTHMAEDSLVQCTESDDFAPSKLGTKE